MKSHSSSSKKLKKKHSSRKHDKRDSSSKKHKHHKRKHGKSGKHRKGGDDSDGDAPGVKRSVITGEVIKMKIDKTADDRARERGRAELLAFMNSQY